MLTKAGRFFFPPFAHRNHLINTAKKKLPPSSEQTEVARLFLKSKGRLVCFLKSHFPVTTSQLKSLRREVAEGLCRQWLLGAMHFGMMPMMPLYAVDGDCSLGFKTDIEWCHIKDYLRRWKSRLCGIWRHSRHSRNELAGTGWASNTPARRSLPKQAYLKNTSNITGLLKLQR